MKNKKHDSSRYYKGSDIDYVLWYLRVNKKPIPSSIELQAIEEEIDPYYDEELHRIFTKSMPLFF